jgi:GNAT superfamily N-acetyltransferase
MTLTVDRLPAQEADDAALLGLLVGLINGSYAAAEDGLWLPGAERTDLTQTRAAIAAGTVVVAHIGSTLVGTVQTQATHGAEHSFGTLAVDARASGQGVGSALVERVERDARVVGARSMRLEVLIATPPLPHLVWLANWYLRLGYREVGRTSLAEISPHEADLLARTCEVSVMETALPA